MKPMYMAMTSIKMLMLKERKFCSQLLYHCAWLTFGPLMMFFSDSVKEGDSVSLLKFLKVALLILHSYGILKYAYVLLLFLTKTCHFNRETCL